MKAVNWTMSVGPILDGYIRLMRAKLIELSLTFLYIFADTDVASAYHPALLSLSSHLSKDLF